METDRPGHEDHRPYSDRLARLYAAYELEGEHDTVERLVYREQAKEECYQCITVALLEIIREPLDPETLREEADKINSFLQSVAMGEVKREWEERQIQRETDEE